jgi:PAS domain S-box-containing protein
MEKIDNSQETKELKRKIKSLENQLKRYVKSEKESAREEKLFRELREKEHRIEIQKQELIDKQNQLEESRAKYVDLYESAPVGYLILDKIGIIKEINLTGANILGMDKKFIFDVPFTNFLIPNDANKFRDFIRQSLSLNKLSIEDFTIKNQNLIIQIISKPVYDYKEKELNLRISISDITEKKKIENELMENKERFKLMADASPAIIWMTDENNNLIYMNDKSIDFGCSLDKNLQHEVLLQQIHPDDKSKFDQTFSDALKKKEPFSLEIRIKNPDSEYKWIFNSAAPCFLNGGEFAGYVFLGIDITERKKIRKEIEKSLKEKELLLKEIHHRVKNNLQIILSILSLQKNYITDQPVKDVLNACRNRALSVALIHEQLYRSKDFLRIDFDYYIKVLVNNLLNTYRNSEKIDLNLDVDQINLDVGTSINLGLILNELLTNSLKYAFGGKETGKINISLKYNDEENKIVLKVSDNGLGLPKDFNVNNLNSLGLGIVGSLAEQSGGEFKIINNGKTEFQVVMYSHGDDNSL